MKSILTLAFIIVASQSFAQSPSDAAVLSLSKQIFRWEVEGKVDSLENIFHDQFVVVNGEGVSQSKKQYITTLRSGNFVHNSIDVESDTANVVNNTATVVGKGTFTVTGSGNKITLRLSYIEVFTRPDPTATWKVLAMHATVLPH